MGRHRKYAYGASSDRAETDGTDDSAGSPKSSANIRERQRMRVLSKAFVRLKTTLPWVPVDTKLSKLDTLKLATCYIKHLRHVLSNDPADDGMSQEIIPSWSSRAHEAILPDTTEQSPTRGQALPRAKHHQDADSDLTGNHAPVTSPCDVNRTDAVSQGHLHPINLTWPYTFSGRYSTRLASSADSTKENDCQAAVREAMPGHHHLADSPSDTFNMAATAMMTL